MDSKDSDQTGFVVLRSICVLHSLTLETCDIASKNEID